MNFENKTEKIASWYTSTLFREQRTRILVCLFGILIAFVGGTVYVSQRYQRDIVASYEASEVIRVLESTDFSSEDIPGEGRKQRLENLLQRLRALSESSPYALEKSSGLLANGACAIHDTIPEDDLQMSQKYFNLIEMGTWGQFLWDITHIREEQDGERSSSRRGDLLALYGALLVPGVKDGEREAALRAFFEKYPGFKDALETIWGQKIENLYGHSMVLSLGGTKR